MSLTERIVASIAVLLLLGGTFMSGVVVGEERVLSQPCAIMCSIPETLR